MSFRAQREILDRSRRVRGDNRMGTMVGLRLQSLMDCLKDRAARRIGLSVGVAFLFLYLYSVGNIVIAPGVDLAFGRPIPAASVVSDWAAKMWKPIAPFVWESIAAVYPVRSVGLFISVPNLLLALWLGTLVALNMAVAIARVRLVVAVSRGGGFLSGFVASLPALLTGFTCCVPTIVLALGSVAALFTVAAITIAPYLLPLAALALAGNLLWGLRQFSLHDTCGLGAPEVREKRNQIYGFIRQTKTEEEE